MSIQRPTPWSSILQFNNKIWTDIDRRIIIMDKLEHWSKFNCFHRSNPTPRFKTCRCLESLHGSDGRKNCVIDYILFWARLDKVPRQMIVIEKLKVLNNVGQKKNIKPFIIPFVPCQRPWTNEYMSNKYICKEALGTLFGYSPFALKTLVSHAKKHILPIHGLTGKVDSFSAKFQDNVVPSLAHFFKNEIVPLAGARPN